MPSHCLKYDGMANLAMSSIKNKNSHDEDYQPIIEAYGSSSFYWWCDLILQHLNKTLYNLGS